MLVVPSPKSQSQEVGDPVLVSVNATVNGAFPETEEAENAATGRIVGVTDVTVI